MVDHSIRHLPYTQRAGESDRRFQLAQFIDLGDAEQLSEAVGDVDGRRNAVVIQVAIMWEDDCHTRADRLAFPNGRVADFDSGDVGDGVVAPRLEDARRDPDVSGARALGGLDRSSLQPARGRECQGPGQEEAAMCLCEESYLQA